MPVISIIVPVYNAEKTLPRLMDSLLHQDYPALQILLIDDHSADGSAALCEQYAAAYAHVYFLTSQGKGVSHARNTGLACAEGFYIMFADSDDALSPNACSHMAAQMEGHDLCIGRFNMIINEKSTVRGLLDSSMSLSEEEFMDALLKRPGSFYYSVLWNKMYRADLIQDLNLTFDPECDWGEDFAFNMQYFKGVQRTAVTDQVVYNYYKTLSGASIRTLKRPLHSCRIKYTLYQHLKSLCLYKGIYRQNRGRVISYLGNITLND